MRISNFIRIGIFVLFLGLNVSCGVEAVVFIPLFSATWPDINDEDHFIELRPDSENQNVESGIFAGTEQHFGNQFDLDGNLLSGKFSGYNIEFIIQRGSGDIKYSGVFITDDNENIIRIELTSEKGDPLILAF
ncbi:hypothetical protein [Echinicola sp. 20G]|uniref:hypothetical protein n=1 Tax=Echinicola sp. 20G TaxID=2781961 RepID=UPI001910BC57|nr:hypothetical protein [Echinicola sp. 20G]